MRATTASRKFDANGTFIVKVGELRRWQRTAPRASGVATDAAEMSTWQIRATAASRSSTANGTFLPLGAVTARGWQFKFSGRVATDESGNIYVSDDFLQHAHPEVRLLDDQRPARRPRRSGLGRGLHLPHYLGSFGTSNGQFTSPQRSDRPQRERLRVDFGNNRIQKFDTDGTFLTTWGSFGTSNGQLDNPHGVATDATARLRLPIPQRPHSRSSTPTAPSSPAWGSFRLGQRTVLPPPPAWRPMGAGTSSSPGKVTTASRSSMATAPSSGLGQPGLGNGQFYYPEGGPPTQAGSLRCGCVHNRIQKFDGNGTFLGAWGAGRGNGQFYHPGRVWPPTQAARLRCGYVARRIQKFDDNGTFLGAWGAARAAATDSSVTHGAWRATGAGTSSSPREPHSEVRLPVNDRYDHDPNDDNHKVDRPRPYRRPPPRP